MRITLLRIATAVLVSPLFASDLWVLVSANINPCSPTESSACTAAGHSCQDDDNNDDTCCGGLGCFGYQFFKRCQTPPTCLREWYDCSSGIDCCGDLVCAEVKTGTTTTTTPKPRMECRKEEIGTRKAFIPGRGNLVAAPTPAPVQKNTKTTKVAGKPVTFNVGCWTGDPHFTTFDGLLYDCQGHGEHIITKSTITQREIQGRFMQVEDRTVSTTRGVTIQDEGDTPKVQLSFPIANEGISHQLGSNGCKIQLFVDGEQKDLMQKGGVVTDAVSITVASNAITVKYKVSEMKVVVTMGFWNGCLLNTCAHIPTTDTMVGLMGSPDGNTQNDWMQRDGKALNVPSTRTDLIRKPAYDYCTTNWCIKDATESLFTYNQVGFDFDYFSRCDLPFDTILDEDLEDLITTEIQAACEEDLECLVDAVNGDLNGAKEAKKARQENIQKTKCKKVGGECGIGTCCEGLTCSDKGLAGKVCIDPKATQPKCVNELNLCDKKTPCCEGFQCVERRNKRSFCKEIEGKCTKEFLKCSKDTDCCNGMSCVGPNDKKKCRTVKKNTKGAVCLSKGDACGFGVECCAGTTCVNQGNNGVGVGRGSSRCTVLPQCWDKAGTSCEDGMPKCCAGFECVDFKGRKLCSPLPKCAAKWQSCESVGCCNEKDHPLTCVTSANDKGVARKLCEPVRNNNNNKEKDDDNKKKDDDNKEKDDDNKKKDDDNKNKDNDNKNKVTTDNKDKVTTDNKDKDNGNKKNT